MGKTAGAIVAKFAFPDRVSVAMVGDGTMQMGGMAELLTAAKYYKTWADPRLEVLILNNEDLNAMTKAFVAAPNEGLPGALSAVREFAHEFLPGR
jgi:thiamine pyrophosphate-dependent acetolactate synthase large subunit-like protein